MDPAPVAKRPKPGTRWLQSRERSQTLPLDDEAIGEWLDQSVGDRAAWVRDCIDEHLIGWSDLLAGQGATGGPQKSMVIFLHVPKTGGTTLEDIVARNYGPQGTLHINNAALSSVPEAMFAKGRPARVVMGHHTTCDLVYRFVDRALVHFTMLREPVGRVISYFNYLSTAKNHGKTEAARGRSLEDFVDSKDLVELVDGQVRRLTGYLRPRTVGPNDLPMDEQLDLAKAMLRDRMSFFGLTERYDDFLLLGHRLLSWSDILYSRRNISGRRVRREDVPEAVIETIRERNAHDIELYEFAKTLFDERCAEAGIDDEVRARYREANAAYSELTAQRFT